MLFGQLQILVELFDEGAVYRLQNPKDDIEIILKYSPHHYNDVLIAGRNLGVIVGGCQALCPTNGWSQGR